MCAWLKEHVQGNTTGSFHGLCPWTVTTIMKSPRAYRTDTKYSGTDKLTLVTNTNWMTSGKNRRGHTCRAPCQHRWVPCNRRKDPGCALPSHHRLPVRRRTRSTLRCWGWPRRQAAPRCGISENSLHLGRVFTQPTFCKLHSHP